jgi:hypothetical protein
MLTRACGGNIRDATSYITHALQHHLDRLQEANLAESTHFKYALGHVYKGH